MPDVISSEILVFLLFHFPDFIIVKGDDFPAVEHAEEQTVVIIRNYRQAVDIFFGEFLEHGIQIVGRRGDDDVGCADVLHAHQVLYFAGKKHTPYIVDGKNADQLFIAVHHREVMLFGGGKKRFEFHKRHVLGDKGHFFYVVGKVFYADGLEDVHEKIAGVGRRIDFAFYLLLKNGPFLGGQVGQGTDQETGQQQVVGVGHFADEDDG